ncbi:MAG: shikimate kinase [Phycisphaerales bacterium]
MADLAGRYLVVIGLRASGKTSAGQLAADRLGIAFTDLDDVTIQRVDGRSFMTVREAWAAAGEPAFRQAEAEALGRAFSMRTDRVLALGGGTTAFADARRVLTEAMDGGFVLGPVYLHAPPEALASRLRQELGDRPSITGEHPADEIAGLYDKRDAIYRALADQIVEVEHLSIDQTADRLVELWHQLAGD